MAPYFGAGFRLNVPYYYVYGINRKDNEGGYVAYEPKGSLLGGIKTFVGGAVFRLELEIPAVIVKQDPGTPLVTLGGGWIF